MTVYKFTAKTPIYGSDEYTHWTGTLTINNGEIVVDTPHGTAIFPNGAEYHRFASHNNIKFDD